MWRQNPPLPFVAYLLNDTIDVRYRHFRSSRRGDRDHKSSLAHPLDFCAHCFELDLPIPAFDAELRAGFEACRIAEGFWYYHAPCPINGSFHAIRLPYSVVVVTPGRRSRRLRRVPGRGGPARGSTRRLPHRPHGSRSAPRSRRRSRPWSASRRRDPPGGPWG